MRGPSLPFWLSFLLATPLAATAQGNLFPEGVSIELGEAEEPHGLLLKTPDDRCQRLEAAGRPCRATDHANSRWNLAFAADPGFKIDGRDTITIIAEYLDNGDAPMAIQYQGRDGTLTSAPIERGNSGEWKTARWQITDPAFAVADGQGISFQLHANGWFDTNDLHLASVRVTHEAVRVQVERDIVPADGATEVAVTVDVFRASGEPAADGTEVTLTTEGVTAPAGIITENGRATFTVTSPTEPGTTRIEARCGDASGRAILYCVAGEGPLVELTQAVDVDSLRETLKFSGREADSVTVVKPEEGGDPDVVEVRLTFPADAERNRALLTADLAALPGKPDTLRIDVGSNGTLTYLNILLRDRDGDLFLYSVYAKGEPLNGWYTGEVDVDRLGYVEGRDMDRVLELPLHLFMFSLFFEPGTTEGVVRLRNIETDCVGTMAEAEQVTGPVRELKTEPVIIEGVPAMGADVGQFCRQISALTKVLEVLGCDAGYEELMVTSGAAFSIAWCPGEFNYAVVEACPEDMIVNAALAAGVSAQRVEYETPGEAWEALFQSIDDGRPAIAPYAWGARIVYGYDPDERLIYQQANLTPQDQPQTVDFAKMCETRRPGQPINLVLLDYDPATGRPERDWVPILDRAIRFADWPLEERVDGVLTFGPNAYDEWAERVRAGAGDATVKVAVDLTWGYAQRIAEKRRAAAVVLAEDAMLHESLGEAAEHYRAAAELLDQMLSTLWAGGPATRVEANFADQGVRDVAASLILQAKQEEMKGVDALRVALADLRATQPEPTATEPTAPPPAGADLLRTARRLKAQRRFAEAAQELAKAIEANPNDPEAQWVLAWVLIDLQDDAGAAAAFRKVIELAPGSGYAREAEKALERLGR